MEENLRLKKHASDSISVTFGCIVLLFLFFLMFYVSLDHE